MLGEYLEEVSHPYILHAREQWNVGQGGFHSAYFYSPRPLRDVSFRYVYDCGTLSKRLVLDQALKRFVASMGPHKEIDAVFLSHIDADHVNGLPSLLGSLGVRAHRIFLPLLSPVERLLAAARAGRALNQFMVSMASDPVAALRSISDAAIIQVSRRDDSTDSDDGPEPSESAYDIGRSPALSILGSPDDWRESPDGQVEMTDSAMIQLDANPGRVVPPWLLSFYICQSELDRTSKFRSALARKLGVPDGEVIKADPDLIRHWLTDSASLTCVRAAYRYAGVNINASSLVMISGPAAALVGESVHLGKAAYQGSPATWLLTGDADLSSASAVADLVRHFGSRADRVGVVALPHHGSIDNFHSTLMHVGKHEPAVVYAAAGNSHRQWNHPHASVIKSVTSEGSLPWVVTESPLTQISAEVVFP